MSRMGAYQAAAARCGTLIVRASTSVPPRIGGGITRHPLAHKTADILVRDLRQLGAEAKICGPQNTIDGRVFVYLSGCSFVKGDLI